MQRWLVTLALAVVVTACASLPTTPMADCHGVSGMWGPDTAQAAGPHLLGAAARRRPWRTQPFTLVDRDTRPFHPHGISLVAGARPRLYVINHLSDAEHAVEVFEVEGDRLLFREPRLTSPLLTTPNDLVAQPDGYVYVTNSGVAPTFGGSVTALLGLRRGNVVHYDTKDWSKGPEGFAYANGIAVGRAGDTLYVAGTRDKAIHVFRRRPDTGAIVAQLPPIAVGSGVDNLTWTDQRTLMVAAHPKVLAFLWHALGLAATAPSQVFRVDVNTGIVTTLPSLDANTVSAVSTAILYDGRLYLGQVIRDGIVSCRLS